MLNKLHTLFSVIFLSFIFSQDPCTCENDFEPVCGADGFTYPNECIALCFGTQVDYDGECGSQSNCNPGEYTDIDGNCYLCEPGSFSSDGISCNTCQSGTRSNGQMSCDMPEWEGMSECGATDCIDCDAGSFAMGEGNYSCDVCEPGSFSDMGASECNSCQPGTMSNGQMYCDNVPGWEGMSECGATDCIDCDAGSFAMGEGNFYCEPCESGSYTSSFGASECDVCPNDLYSNGQMECWDGTTECGATECIDCNGQPWGDAVTDENGSCSENQSGCTYIEAYNFDPDAYMDDGSCTFPCQGDFNADSNKDILDIIILVNEILDDVFCE